MPEYNAMTVTKLEGVDQLVANIRKALLKHSVNEVRAALKRGAEVIVAEAKANVRVNDGDRLKNSIKILPKWMGAPATLFVAPKVLRRIRKNTSQKRIDENPFYAHWTEYGTDPHNLGYKAKTFKHQDKGAQHPGAKKQPYMRPAFDTKGQEALNVAMQDIEKMIVEKV